MTFAELEEKAESQGGLLLECINKFRGIGMRSFFDSPSSEWHRCSVEEKVRIFRDFETCGVSFASLLDVFRTSYSDSSRAYIHEDMPCALLEYRQFNYEPELPYDLAAEMIFLDCDSGKSRD